MENLRLRRNAADEVVGITPPASSSKEGVVNEPSPYVIVTKLLNKTWSLERRRELRNNATAAEMQLWKFLRKDQIEGVRFRRQYGVDGYIVDFYAPRVRLAVEVDGTVHTSLEAKEYDRERDEFFAAIDIHVLRFTNDQVFHDTPGVIERIRQFLLKIPLLSKKGE